MEGYVRKEDLYVEEVDDILAQLTQAAEEVQKEGLALQEEATQMRIGMEITKEMIDEITSRNFAQMELGHIDRETARARVEVEIHELWAEQERTKGRPENELTWGNCVRESGTRLGWYKSPKIH